MDKYLPGFGPKKGPWGGFVLAIIFLLIALWSFKNQSGYWYVLWGCLGLLSIWFGINDLKAKRVEEQTLRYAAPMAQAEITTICMDYFDTSDHDLAANRQGRLSQDQLEHVQANISHLFKDVTISPLRWSDRAMGQRLLERAGQQQRRRVRAIASAQPPTQLVQTTAAQVVTYCSLRCVSCVENTINPRASILRSAQKEARNGGATAGLRPQERTVDRLCWCSRTAAYSAMVVQDAEWLLVFAMGQL